MRFDKVADVVILVLIFAAGLVAAYVSFGVLSSEATGQLGRYSVGGAIAGALVSWGVLTSVYLQLRNSSGELKELRERAEELEHKLIRGAPRPQGFETEVDERQRLVLARPKDFQPKGGVILDMEMREDRIQSSDSFPAAFRCYFVPIEPSTPDQAALYQREIDEYQNADHYVLSFSYELIRLGGEAGGVESLKMIARQFVQTRIKRDPATGRVDRSWDLVPKDHATGTLFRAEPERIPAGRTVKIRLSGFSIDKGAQVEVNGRARPTEVLHSSSVAVTLAPEDVEYPGFLQLILKNPAAGKLPSNTVTVAVDEFDSPFHVAEELDAPDAAVAVAETPLPLAAAPDEVNEMEVIQEVVRQRVVCYHTALDRVYIFEFWDDIRDFKQSSAVFNQILGSVRFLD